VRSQITFLSVVVSAMPWLAATAAPVLYRQPAYESPTRGEPDDLLLLAGKGFSIQDRVVYEALTDTTAPLLPPSSVPTSNTATAGIAPVVSTANVPYSLTIRLPDAMSSGQAYALWIRTRSGEWSAGLKINDARPLWLSPAYVYSSAEVAGLPRLLKVIGRNLQPSSQHRTRVRLIGPQTLVLSAAPGAASDVVGQYTAEVTLPAHLAPGSYRVEVTRDEQSWAPLPGQKLEVRPDRPAAPSYSIDEPRFGDCRPNDGNDDTGCLLKALAAAVYGGGGVVVVPEGTWSLIDSGQSGLVPGEGIVVPEGVDLRGAGRGHTVLERYAQWSRSVKSSALTVLGHSSVRGFTFRDRQRYTPADKESAGPFIQVGESSDRMAPLDPNARTLVDDVTISDNIFDRTLIGVGAGGVPIRRLFITHNEFGAYDVGVLLSANIYNTVYKFRLDDSVIAYNVFKPGSYFDPVEHTGTTASQLGAGYRLDFSHNLADGSAIDYLYDPSDPRGWRAGYFWHLSNNHELLLISRNVATCTGDKIGDGEAIALDNSTNTFAFTQMQPVLRATRDSTTVTGPLVEQQHQRAIPLSSYYIGHWVQIGDGPGIGQVRRITGYELHGPDGGVTLHVAPDWDVAPVAHLSRISVGQEYWQVYLLDNLVDHRRPVCIKSNRSQAQGGEISVWAQTADSVVAGNHQFDTDGILVHENYSPNEHRCAECTAETFFQSFLQIHDNDIEGSYRGGAHCSTSGIATDVSAAPWRDAPPTVGFGLSIDHNSVRHAFNTLTGSAIAMPLAWYAGPEPHDWPLLNNPLVYHNVIDGSPPPDSPGPESAGMCARSATHSAIGFPKYHLVWHAVLYANSCHGVSRPISGSTTDAISLCPTSDVARCECDVQ
jgi:hypothetical protein